MISAINLVGLGFLLGLSACVLWANIYLYISNHKIQNRKASISHQHALSLLSEGNSNNVVYIHNRLVARKKEPVPLKLDLSGLSKEEKYQAVLQKMAELRKATKGKPVVKSKCHAA